MGFPRSRLLPRTRDRVGTSVTTALLPPGSSRLSRSRRIAQATRSPTGAPQTQPPMSFAALRRHRHPNPHTAAGILTPGPTPARPGWADARCLLKLLPGRGERIHAACMSDTDKEEELFQDALRNAQGGDRKAFDLALQPLLPWLAEMARNRMHERLRSVLEPDDLTQDVLLTLYRTLRHGTIATPKSLRGRLVFLLDHRMRDLERRHFRSRRPISTARSLADDAGHTQSGALSCLGDLVQANGATPSQHARLHEDHRRLEAILATLKPDHRTVIELACLQDLPIREVATRMGRSPEAIHKLLARALEACGDEHRNGLPGHREPSP